MLPLPSHLLFICLWVSLFGAMLIMNFSSGLIASLPELSTAFKIKGEKLGEILSFVDTLVTRASSKEHGC